MTPDSVTPDPRSGGFDNVLVAIDGGPRGEEARALAAALAVPGAAITTVHVADHRGATGVGADVTVAGPFHAALSDLVRQRRPDLLVIGSHNREHVWSTNHVRSALHAVACSVAISPEAYSAETAHAIARIGVGYDEGAESAAALMAARSLAARIGATVEVIEVVPDSNLVSADSTTGWKAASAAARLSELEGVEVRVLEGDTQNRLREAAREVDLLVLGEHHPDLPSRILLDRTGERLAQGLHCPLLLHHG